jgi:hypothetical protein
LSWKSINHILFSSPSTPHIILYWQYATVSKVSSTVLQCVGTVRVSFLMISLLRFFRQSFKNFSSRTE